MKLIHFGWVVVLSVPLGVSGAQAAQQAQTSSQGSSLADAAKATRDAKKDQPKAAHVWDNDTLPTTPGGVNVVGQSSGEEGAAGGSANAGATGAPGAAAPADDKAKLEADLASAKEKLQSLQVDLNILQRTNTLDQQSYYGKPDFQDDKDGAKKLKDEQTAIDAKQQQIEDLEKQIADLQNKISTMPDSKPAEQPAGNSGATQATPPAAPAAPAGNSGGDNGNAGAANSGQEQPSGPNAPVPNN